MIKRTDLNWITDKNISKKEYSTDFLSRMGFIFKSEPGIYYLSPMANLFLKNLKNKISSKMNFFGYYEMLGFPISNKKFWNKRENILNDAFVCGEKVIHPTSEEIVFPLLEKYNIPKAFFFSHNFRNEMRPSFGLCRTISFVMKDAYAIFKTKEEMEKEYEKILKLYEEIFSSFDINIFLDKSVNECQILAYSKSDLKTDINQSKNVVELGHIFKFNEIFDNFSLSFGIGVTRLMQFIVLNNSLNKILPFKYAVCPRDYKDKSKTDIIYENLVNENSIDSIFYDDTNKSLGEKIYDLKSIGFEDKNVFVS